jgi:hypothetical protein
MIFVGIIFALFFAFILTVSFSFLFRNTGPWNSFWVFFFLVFLMALGTGEWAAPVGPSAWGYYWVPGLIAGIIIALALAAVKPISRPFRKINPDISETDRANEETALKIGLFVWILIILLMLLSVCGIALKFLHMKDSERIIAT